METSRRQENTLRRQRHSPGAGSQDAAGRPSGQITLRRTPAPLTAERAARPQAAIGRPVRGLERPSGFAAGNKLPRTDMPAVSLWACVPGRSTAAVPGALHLPARLLESVAGAAAVAERTKQAVAGPRVTVPRPLRRSCFCPSRCIPSWKLPR